MLGSTIKSSLEELLSGQEQVIGQVLPLLFENPLNSIDLSGSATASVADGLDAKAQAFWQEMQDSVDLSATNISAAEAQLFWSTVQSQTSLAGLGVVAFENSMEDEAQWQSDQDYARELAENMFWDEVQNYTNLADQGIVEWDNPAIGFGPAEPAVVTLAVGMTISGTENADYLMGTVNDDTITAYGGDDYVLGSTGNDSIMGGTGADILDGGTGNDTLLGDSGNDVLVGGAGNDILWGGAGKDFLTGSAGADNFTFDAAGESSIDSNRDIISDFRRIQGDKIDLSGIDANVQIGLNQAFSFIGTGAFTDAAQLRYENTFDAAGNVSGSIIYGNVDNVRGADFSIFVSSFPTPNANDFIP